MKIITQILCFTAFTIGIISCQHQNASFIDLEGKALSRSEIKASESPYLQILPSQSSRGTIVFYPGSEYENDSVATIFHQMGFSVATLKGNNIDITDVGYKILGETSQPYIKH